MNRIDISNAGISIRTQWWFSVDALGEKGVLMLWKSGYLDKKQGKKGNKTW
jgi:hypothetical protein